MLKRVLADIITLVLDSRHFVRSVVFHASCSELSAELMDALYGLNLAAMVGNIERFSRYDVGHLPQDFNLFMQWLGNEVCDKHISCSLTKRILTPFHSMILILPKDCYDIIQALYLPGY